MGSYEKSLIYVSRHGADENALLDSLYRWLIGPWEHFNDVVIKYLGRHLNPGLLTPKLSVLSTSFEVDGPWRLDQTARVICITHFSFRFLFGVVCPGSSRKHIQRDGDEDFNEEVIQIELDRVIQALYDL